MSLVRSVSCVVCAAIVLPGVADAGARALEPQYVIVSFDGAREVSQWQRSRELAARTGARFTYFISCVFLLPRDERASYAAPGHGAGRSNVGFAEDRGDVAERLSEIWSARQEGHEIASHGCGHFDGAAWSRADWLSEFDAFSTTLRDAWSLYGAGPEPDGWRSFAANEVIGFRAPYLSTGAGLYEALGDDGFAYDASGVSRGPAMPGRIDGTVRFALPQIPEGPSGRRVIAMDYNLFVRHSAGIERTDEGAEFENRTYDAFQAAFRTEYLGERIPLQIGLHFTLMNGGAYWRALERFVTDACGMPRVVCTSYEDYLRRTTPAETRTGVGG